MADIFGSIEAPAGVEAFNAATGTPDGIGLIIFVSNLIQLVTIVAGIWVMFNFILAGWQFITAEDKNVFSKVQQKLTQSVIGLVIIVASYLIAGLIGLLLFGDASYIINPQIQGPTTALPSYLASLGLFTI